MEIRNVVTSITFDRSFELILQEALFAGKTHRPKCFDSVYNVLNDSSFCQILANGKAIVNGGQSELDSHLLVKRYQYALQEIGFTAEIVKSEVVSIIATDNFGCRLNLDRFAETFRLLYEPELFPAVRFCFVIYDVTLNVFHTGKCTILGARTADDARDCVDLLVKNVYNRCLWACNAPSCLPFL